MCAMVLTLVNRAKGNVPPPAPVADRSVDYLGALLLIGATIALIAAVDHRIMEALAPGLRVALVLGFFVVFLGFLYREKTTPSPILDLSLFRIRMFTLSGLALLLVGVAQVMIGFVLPFYLQDVLNLKPSFIGLLFVSAPIFTVTLSPLVGWAVDKVGPRLPATMGIAFLACAGFVGSYLRTDSHWLSAVLVLGLWGLATALFFTSNHTAMITSVPTQHRGVATGAIYVMFGLGHDVRCFPRHHALDRIVPLLHRRSGRDSDSGQPGDVRALDELQLHDRRIYGVASDAVVRAARRAPCFRALSLCGHESFVI